MTTVSETIPEALQPEVGAALAWFNQQQDLAFEVTGIVDGDAALSAGDSRELRLVLCGGDRCEQRSFRVTGSNDAWVIEFTDNMPAQQGEKPQAELDPPPGVRNNWLEKALSQHAFVVLLFYRGFW